MKQKCKPIAWIPFWVCLLVLVECTGYLGWSMVDLAVHWGYYDFQYGFVYMISNFAIVSILPLIYLLKHKSGSERFRSVAVFACIAFGLQVISAFFDFFPFSVIPGGGLAYALARGDMFSFMSACTYYLPTIAVAVFAFVSENQVKKERMKRLRLAYGVAQTGGLLPQEQTFSAPSAMGSSVSADDSCTTAVVKETAFCSGCGTKYVAATRFCSVCGRPRGT